MPSPWAVALTREPVAMRTFIVEYVTDDNVTKRRYEDAPDRTLAADQAAHYEAAKRGRTIEVLSVSEAVAPFVARARAGGLLPKVTA